MKAAEMIDERTERLISRRLDGALSDAEALELDKRLIRSPAARQLLEAYERNDRLAGEVLQAWSAEAPAGRAATQIAQRSSRRVDAGVWAAAAALALVSLIGLPITRPRPPGTPSPRPLNAIASLPLRQVAPAAAVPVIEGPRREMHELRRSVVGVWDEETQSIYVLELDQRAETVVPVAMNF